MSLRQQQILVFGATVAVIFGLFAVGTFLVAQRLTTEATLQTALLLARQVEIALAESLQQRPAASPPPAPAPASPPSSSSGSFWDFLGRLFPGNSPSPPAQAPTVAKAPALPRDVEAQGLIKAYIDRSSSIQAMWVLNSDGKVLYASRAGEQGKALDDPSMRESLKQGITTIQSHSDGKNGYYDVLVPLQMPKGVRGPGGLRLWINPSSWTEMVTGLWRQFTFLFLLGGGVSLLSAFLTTALYTRRFRVISDALRQAEAGTYQQRPQYASRDEVGTSLDLIDRLVMKQRGSSGSAGPLQRVAMAARTLVHEVRTPLNAMAVHLELLRDFLPVGDRKEAQTDHSSIEAIEASVRQVDQLVRDFADYSTPVTLERKPLDLAQVLAASLEAATAQCTAQGISVSTELPPGPWPLQGDAHRLRQAFDNLLRNAIEAQPEGGSIRVSGERNRSEVVLRFSDGGPGIPPERRRSIFEFGHSTKLGGTGIGLPLSQLIAEAHGGALAYEENSGSGAVFRLSLPLRGAA
jgi:signal transduction histidine kinase